MSFFLHRSPSLLRWFLSDYTWKIDTAEKVIYLTFDDGPIPVVTEYVMRELERFEARATFFCIGDNVRKHPGVFRELKDRGHSIGNHTYHHLNGWKTDKDIYIDNFKKCQDILDIDTALFRPPYGRIKREQFRLLPDETRLVMWDVLTGDFSPKINRKNALVKCIALSGEGTILLLHDSLKAERNLTYMLPTILKHFSEKGFRFEALPMRNQIQ